MQTPRPERLGLLLAPPDPKPGQGIDATVIAGKLFSYTVDAPRGGKILVAGIVQPADRAGRYALDLSVYAVRRDDARLIAKLDEPLRLTRDRRETLRAIDGKELWVTLGVAEGKSPR